MPNYALDNADIVREAISQQATAVKQADSSLLPLNCPVIFRNLILNIVSGTANSGGTYNNGTVFELIHD